MFSAALSFSGNAAAATAVDDRLEWSAFSRRVAGNAAERGVWESHAAVEGMHCAACSLAVEQALRAVPGVTDAHVNAASRMARVVWDDSVTRPSAWLAAVVRAGYTALPATGIGEREQRSHETRALLWRWLVAGFCMMQVMMYAVPAYVAAPGEMTPDVAQLLRWASWVLTLPVLLFSCKPFFAAAWADLRRGTVGMDVPVALGILIAFGASTAATFDAAGVSAGGEVWYDSLTMLVFFLLSGRVLEQRLRDRTAGALEALSRRLPDSVERLQAGGGFVRVSIRRIQPGDTLRVLPGEAFPADGEVTEGHTHVDEALLTGESRPLPRSPGTSVIAGSHNLSGTVCMRVERTGADTRYAAIVALMNEAATGKPSAALLADRLARPFLLGVLMAAAAAAAWWWPVDPSRAVGVAIAVLIVTCPCALSLATPVAMLASAGALARRGVLLRHLRVLETCTALDTVVFDKTGTLTDDRMAVDAIHTCPGLTADRALALAAALARHSLHPVSRALAAACVDAAVPDAGAVQELPGKGVVGWVGQGAERRLLRLGDAGLCGVPPEHPGTGGHVHLADDQRWLASFELREAVRPGASATIDRLRGAGLHVQLLSGDDAGRVAHLARRLGIDRSFGNRTPTDKLAHVRGLQSTGHRVAMVGDGINDAPVLARADVSVALGGAAALARARADVVVPGGQLEGVALLLAQARRTQNVVRQNLAWAAAYNAVCVPLAVAGWMPPWLAGLGMAASSLAVVLNAARLARLPGTVS